MLTAIKGENNQATPKYYLVQRQIEQQTRLKTRR